MTEGLLLDDADRPPPQLIRRIGMHSDEQKS